jgi:hypothetical protein
LSGSWPSHKDPSFIIIISATQSVAGLSGRMLWCLDECGPFQQTNGHDVGCSLTGNGQFPSLVVSAFVYFLYFDTVNGSLRNLEIGLQIKKWKMPMHQVGPLQAGILLAALSFCISAAGG